MSEAPSGIEHQVSEPPSFAVRDFLTERGYKVGDYMGYDRPEFANGPQDALGIFIPPTEQSKGIKRLFSKPRSRLIGEIDLYNNSKNEELKDAEWVLKVFGRSNLEAAQSLAVDLSERAKKRVGVFLERETEKAEVRPGDFD